jgi:hypothetical protein
MVKGLPLHLHAQRGKLLWLSVAMCREAYSILHMSTESSEAA